MSFQLPGTVQTNNPVLLHEWAGPFSGANETAAIAAANAYIPSGVRLVGLEVTLIIGGVPKKYWYGTGTANGDLVSVTPRASLTVRDEGTVLYSPATTLNFVGGGATASSITSGNVSVNVRACPTITKVASMSGSFVTNGSSYPLNIGSMLIGNNGLGWSYGTYNLSCNSDSSGNILSINANQRYCAIPIPMNLNAGDVINIHGNVFGKITTNPPSPWNFFLSVSTVDCSTLETGVVPASSLIPTVTIPFDVNTGNSYLCFNESVVLTSPINSCNTYILVGMQGGSNASDVSSAVYLFTYSINIIR